MTRSDGSRAYFRRTGVASYTPTEHVSGAWNQSEQHVGPAIGLLVHAVELDRDARRDDRLLPARLSYDIWGTVPMAEVGTSVRVLRAGRTIELVEASLTHADRTIVTLRAWLVRQADTTALAGSDALAVPGPDEVAAWDPTTLWPGGYIAAADVRRHDIAPGRAVAWARTDVALVDGEPTSTLAARAALFDIVNGMAVRADPGEVAFPNLDLTVHLLREPVGEWVGFDTTVSFGPTAVGLTHAVLHDGAGPLGTISQVLTLRPTGAGRPRPQP